MNCERTKHLLAVIVCAICQHITVYAQEQQTIPTTDFNTKAYLRRGDYYRFAAISFFEADSATALRFKKKFTPGLKRTLVLESAESECANTDEIKLRTQRKREIPFLLTDDPNCEVVRHYYQALAGFVEIGKVYVVTAAYQRGTEPIIIGTVCIQSPYINQIADPDFLLNSINDPLSYGLLDAKELQAVPTQEYETKDSGKTVVVKGSITQTSFKTMYEYIADGIKRGIFLDCTEKIRPPFTRYTPLSNIATMPKEFQQFLKSKGVLDSIQKADRDYQKAISLSIKEMPSSVCDKPKTAEEALTTLSTDVFQKYILARWRICDPYLQSLLRWFLNSNAPSSGTDSSVYAVGRLRHNGKYDVIMLEIGQKKLLKTEIDNIMLYGTQEILSDPAQYCHEYSHIVPPKPDVLEYIERWYQRWQVEMQEQKATLKPKAVKTRTTR